jgi:copper chaperone NosL
MMTGAARLHDRLAPATAARKGWDNMLHRHPSARIRTQALLILVCLIAAGCSKTETPSGTDKRSGPLPGLQGIDVDGQLRVSESDRCPVCAMKVKDHPKFACAIELDDGRAFYFCATGCMIRAWLHPEAFLRVERSALRRSVVQDYFDGRHLDGLSVLWVAGSDVVGPMGPALVAVADERALEAFTQRHGGTSTFRLADLDDAKWESITGRKALPRDR